MFKCRMTVRNAANNCRKEYKCVKEQLTGTACEVCMCEFFPKMCENGEKSEER